MANISPSRVGMVLASLLVLAIFLLSVATYIKVRQLENPTVLTVNPPVLIPSPVAVASPSASASAVVVKKVK